MKVNFFSEKEKAKKIKKELFKCYESTLISGSYTNGPLVKKFENSFKNKLKSKYCVAVNSGTSALHLALKSLNIGEGDEVIVPSITFLASAAAINYSGAKPVFVDISKEDWLIDINKIEKHITKKTKAIMVVHLHGLMCDMKAIKNISKKYNLYIIEDASQAHGSEYCNKMPGYYSDVATFSFYPTKNLGAIGEGGAIVTNNKQIYEKSSKLRTWAMNKNNFFSIGYNYRMSEIIASSLNVKLKFLDGDIKKRISIAKIYKEQIVTDNYSNFNSKIKKHSYHIFALEIKKRNDFIDYLKNKNIDTSIHYSYCLPMLTFYKKNNNFKKIYKTGINISNRLVSLPIYPELSSQKLEYTIAKVNEAINIFDK